MTSVMSRTGEPEYGQSAPEALAVLTAQAGAARARSTSTTRSRRIARLRLASPTWIDEDELRARAAAAYDRCFCPAGIARQMQAVMADGSRADALRDGAPCPRS